MHLILKSVSTHLQRKCKCRRKCCAYCGEDGHSAGDCQSTYHSEDSDSNHSDHVEGQYFDEYDVGSDYSDMISD